MKKVLLITMITAAVLFGVCSHSQALPKNTGLSVAESLSYSGEFQCFSKLLQASGLAKTLKGKGPYTVFAPNDAAFAKLPPGTVDRLMYPQNKCELNRLIRYHIVSNQLSCPEIASCPKIKTTDGRCISVSQGCNQLCLDQAQVLQTDICARNGLIHVVDNVLLPGEFLSLK